MLQRSREGFANKVIYQIKMVSERPFYAEEVRYFSQLEEKNKQKNKKSTFRG